MCASRIDHHWRFFLAKEDGLVSGISNNNNNNDDKFRVDMRKEGYINIDDDNNDLSDADIQSSSRSGFQHTHRTCAVLERHALTTSPAYSNMNLTGFLSYLCVQRLIIYGCRMPNMRDSNIIVSMAAQFINSSIIYHSWIPQWDFPTTGRRHSQLVTLQSVRRDEPTSVLAGASPFCIVPTVEYDSLR